MSNYVKEYGLDCLRKASYFESLPSSYKESIINDDNKFLTKLKATKLHDMNVYVEMFPLVREKAADVYDLELQELIEYSTRNAELIDAMGAIFFLYLENKFHRVQTLAYLVDRHHGSILNLHRRCDDYIDVYPFHKIRVDELHKRIVSDDDTKPYLDRIIRRRPNSVYSFFK